MSRILPLLLACLAPLSAAFAQDWPRFRGPNGAGISDATTIPTRWTEQDYRWKLTLPGKGCASPVIWGDRLFVTCGDKEAKRIVLCLRTSDGGELWRREFPSTAHKVNSENSFATSTPALDSQRIYLMWTTPSSFLVTALTHDGKDAWQADLGPFDTEHGSGASLIVHGDLVIVPNDQDGPSSLRALDAATGKLRWSVDRPGSTASYSTPSIYQPPTGAPLALFTNRTLGVTAVDVQAGRVAWEVPEVFGFRCVGSPVVAPWNGGMVLASCGEAYSGKWLVAVNIAAAASAPRGVPAALLAPTPAPAPAPAPAPGPGGAATTRRPATTGPSEAPSPEKQRQLAYVLTDNAPYVPTPIVKDDLLFTWAERGAVGCYRGATGERLWLQRVPGRFYGSPVWVHGHLYIIANGGEVVVMKVDEKKGEVVGRYPLGETSNATPAVAGGRMFLRTHTKLVCIGAE